jgi:hypothetical protein
LEGRTVKVPVFLRRRPTEPIDEALRAFYHRLLAVIKARAFHEGEWRLCERSGWPDNPSFLNVVSWCWRAGRERHVLVVNLSDARSQARIRLPWEDLAGRSWRLTDAFSGEVYERDGNVMRDPGLYVDLDAWGFHCLQG